MQSITINISNDKLAEKVIWLLEHFKNDGLEIVSREDIDDLKLLKAIKKGSLTGRILFGFPGLDFEAENAGVENAGEMGRLSAKLAAVPERRRLWKQDVSAVSSLLQKPTCWVTVYAAAGVFRRKPVFLLSA